MSTVAVVAPLPAVAGHAPESGVAQYTESLVAACAGEQDIVVLAQAATASASIGRAKIYPTWQPSLSGARQITKVLAEVQPSVVHLQHEFNLFGGQLQTALVTGAIAARRRCPLVVTIHGVVDPSDVTHELLEANYLPDHVRLVKTAFVGAYRFLGTVASHIIVHHQHFKDVLARSYGVERDKVSVIPLGHEPPTTGPRRIPSADRLKLLVLGFLTGYKQPEAVVSLAESSQLPGAHFQFCVGRNARVTAPGYARRYESLERRVRALSPERASFRGFVPEGEVGEVLAAADVLVLPYSQCLSATAVAALAIRANLPIAYSRQLGILLGDGPEVFNLSEPASIADAVLAAAAGGPPHTELLAPWPTVAQQTQAVWAAVR